MQRRISAYRSTIDPYGGALMIVPLRATPPTGVRHQTLAPKRQVVTATSCTNAVDVVQHTLGKGLGVTASILHAITHIHARDQVQEGTMILRPPLVHRTLHHQETKEIINPVRLEAPKQYGMPRHLYEDVSHVQKQRLAHTIIL